MASDENPGQTFERPEFRLTGLSIYLSNPSTDPALVNPDFLRHNEIVDPTWTVMRPVVIDHRHSQIRYSNGLTFSASVDHVIIAQRAAVDEGSNSFIPLELDDIVCVSAATNYLETVTPDAPYDFMTIDPSGMLEIDLNETADLTSPLQDLAARVQFEGLIPDVQARAQYFFPDKGVTIYTSEISPDFDSERLRIMVSGEIFHNLDEDVSVQTTTIKDSLRAWEQDVKLFRELVYRFYSTYVSKER